MKRTSLFLVALLVGCQTPTLPPEQSAQSQAQAMLDAWEASEQEYRNVRAQRAFRAAHQALESYTRPAACGPACDQKGAAYLPRGLRMENYGGGSCYHAAMAMVFGNSNEIDWGDDWTNNHWGGESAGGLHAKLDRAGIDYAATTTGQRELLDYCNRTSRIAAITYKSSHVCAFIRWEIRGGYRYAVIVDPNHTEVEEVIPEAAFLSKWRYHGGCATTIIAHVNPPSLIN